MMKQTFSMGNVSDAMVRIGGARGVDFVGQQLNVTSMTLSSSDSCSTS
jgi:hypothetical protein